MYDWIGEVHYCCLLYTRSLYQPFSYFDGFVFLSPLHESDEKRNGIDELNNLLKPCEKQKMSTIEFLDSEESDLASSDESEDKADDKLVL